MQGPLQVCTKRTAFSLHLLGLTQCCTGVPPADAHQQTFKALVKHPSKWTKAEVVDWFNGACGGAFQRTGPHDFCFAAAVPCVPCSHAGGTACITDCIPAEELVFQQVDMRYSASVVCRHFDAVPPEELGRKALLRVHG